MDLHSILITALDDKDITQFSIGVVRDKIQVIIWEHHMRNPNIYTFNTLEEAIEMISTSGWFEEDLL